MCVGVTSTFQFCTFFFLCFPFFFATTPLLQNLPPSPHIASPTFLLEPSFFLEPHHIPPFFFLFLNSPERSGHTHTPPLFSLFFARPPHPHLHASSLPPFSFCYFLQRATTIASPHSRHHHCVMHHHRDPSSTQSPSPLKPLLRPLPRATKVTTP